MKFEYSQGDKVICTLPPNKYYTEPLTFQATVIGISIQEYPLEYYYIITDIPKIGNYKYSAISVRLECLERAKV